MELPDRNQRDEEATELVVLLLLLARENVTSRIGEDFSTERIDEPFWDRMEEGTRQTVLSLLALAFLASAELHGATAADQRASAWEAARQWAARHSEWFSRVTTDATRRMLEQQLADWRRRQEAGATISRDEQERAWERIFGRDRAAVWASDLITAAQTRGGEWAVNEFGDITGDDLWTTAQDERVCPICQPLDMTPRRVWGQDFPEGPPVHPTCRCSISYSSLSVGEAA